ncbi:hypothetical protein CSUI_006078 [Cystoisospora suis]|uniref:Uncharacterized protein n=1 Tax=Cystoisospora suis TaxID=483139 RepID=A0A2C6KT02_9APIC|nr:hypothetical protein CSUI_006078 [Cystoisospora suis]
MAASSEAEVAGPACPDTLPQEPYHELWRLKERSAFLESLRSSVKLISGAEARISSCLEVPESHSDSRLREETEKYLAGVELRSAVTRVARACVCTELRDYVSELFGTSTGEEVSGQRDRCPVLWSVRVLLFLCSTESTPRATHFCVYDKTTQQIKWTDTVEKARLLIGGRLCLANGLGEFFDACLDFLYFFTSRHTAPENQSTSAFLSTPTGLDFHFFVSALIQSHGQREETPKSEQPHPSSSTQATALPVSFHGNHRSEDRFLRLLGVYDNFSQSVPLVSRGRSHSGFRTVQKSILRLASKCLVHASALPIGISLRLWKIFASQSAQEGRESSSPGASKADSLADSKRYSKKNSQNLLSIVASSIRTQSHNVLELRATVDCFREALDSPTFLHFLQRELLGSAMGLMGTCMYTAGELVHADLHMPLAAVAELMAYLAISSSSLRHHVAVQLNENPADLPDPAKACYDDPRVRSKHSRQLSKLSFAAVHFPHLLRASVSPYTEARVFMGAFLEICLSSRPSDTPPLGIHVPERERKETLAALLDAAVPARIQDAGVLSAHPIDNTSLASRNALSLSQKRAASLSLLVTMAESASFGSEVQTLLEDMIMNTAKQTDPDHVPSLLWALNLIVDFSRCSPRSRQLGLAALRQEDSSLLRLLARAIMSSSDPTVQRRVLLVVYKLHTEFFATRRRGASPADRRLPVCAFFLSEKTELGVGPAHSAFSDSSTVGSSSELLPVATNGTASSSAAGVSVEASEDKDLASVSSLAEAPRGDLLSPLSPMGDSTSLLSGFRGSVASLPGKGDLFYTRLLPLVTPAYGNWEASVDLDAFAEELAHVARLQRERQVELEDDATEARTREEDARKLMKITTADHQRERAKAEQEAQAQQEELRRLKEHHRDELTRVRTECDAETREVRGMMSELQQLLDTKEEKLKRVQEALATNRQRQLSNEGECTKLQRQIQTLNALNQKQKDDLCSMETRCGALLAANQESVKKFHDISCRARKLEEDCLQLQNDKESLLEEQEKLFKQLILLLDREQRLTVEQKRLREKVKENDDARERLDELQQQLDMLRHEKEDTGKAAGQMASRTTTLQTEVDALRSDLRKEMEKRRAAEELASSAADRAQSFSEELERMKKKLKAQATHTEDLESRLKQKEEQLLKIQSVFSTKV